MMRLGTLLLALIVALSSVTMAAARHHAPVAGWAAFCTGTGVVAIALDAQGNPTGPMLPCPDCTPALTALGVPEPAAASPVWRLRAVSVAAAAPGLTPGRHPGHRHARAPPAPV